VVEQSSGHLSTEAYYCTYNGNVKGSLQISDKLLIFQPNLEADQNQRLKHKDSMYEVSEEPTAQAWLPK
jgi:hypothetical protein